MALAALALSCGSVLAQDQAFNVYGFADAKMEKGFREDNHFLYTYLNSEPLWSVDHFNLYFDFKPMPTTRALLEIGFIHQTTLEPATFADQIITTHFSGVNPAIAPLLAANGFTETRTDTAKGKSEKSTNIPSIERAYFDILLHPKLNVRLGKFITPAGIWNVDHGSPVILTVAQPNQTALIPIFPEKQSGIMLYGNGYFGDHDYDYTAYVSTGTDPDKNALDGIQDLSGGGHAGLKLDLPVKVKLGASVYSGLTRYTKAVGYSDRTIPYSQVSTLDTTVAPFPLPDPAKLVPAMSIPPAFDQVHYKDVVVQQDRHLAWGVDGRFDYQAAFLQAEFNQRFTANELNKDKTAKVTGYYFILGYKVPVNEAISLTPYGMYEAIFWERMINTPSTSGFSNLPMEGFDRWLGGVNIGLLGNMYVKIEYVYSLLRDLDTPPALPFMKLNYKAGDTDVSVFSTQFAIAF